MQTKSAQGETQRKRPKVQQHTHCICELDIYYKLLYTQQQQIG